MNVAEFKLAANRALSSLGPDSKRCSVGILIVLVRPDGKRSNSRTTDIDLADL